MRRRAARAHLPVAIAVSAAAVWYIVPAATSARSEALPAQPIAQTPQGPSLEHFLRTARVADTLEAARDDESSRVVLELQTVQLEASWITLDSTRRAGNAFDPLSANGRMEESYRAECAAYELDRLLELGMVPATVERTLSGTRGALAIVLPSAITEAERLGSHLVPPDAERWERQVLKVRFFDALIYNADRRPETTLVTPDWDIRLIGHARAFRKVSTIREPDSLTRFSSALVAAAGRLDEPRLRRSLGRYVSTGQIRALIDRRDRLLVLARALAAERGADVVYYP